MLHLLSILTLCGFGCCPVRPTRQPPSNLVMSCKVTRLPPQAERLQPKVRFRGFPYNSYDGSMIQNTSPKACHVPLSVTSSPSRTDKGTGVALQCGPWHCCSVQTPYPRACGWDSLSSHAGVLPLRRTFCFALGDAHEKLTEEQTGTFRRIHTDLNVGAVVLVHKCPDPGMSRPPPTPVYTLRGAGGPLNTLHFHCSQGATPLLFSGSGKGQNLISHGRDMQICLWDLSEGRSDAVDSIWTGSVGFCQSSLLETSPGKSLLAFPGQQTEEIQIVELPSKSVVSTLVPEAKLGMVMCLKLWQNSSGTGPLLLAGYEDGSVLLWDVTHSRLKGISGSSDSKLLSWIVDSENNIQKSQGPKEEEAPQDPGVINQLLVTQRWQDQGPRAELSCHSSHPHALSSDEDDREKAHEEGKDPTGAFKLSSSAAQCDVQTVPPGSSHKSISVLQRRRVFRGSAGWRTRTTRERCSKGLLQDKDDRGHGLRKGKAARESQRLAVRVKYA
ncbi:hypothetical protein WMY93_004064 [Mugilogobius chulae]|uniref:Uncharacterized protein n=1 Tax=Mugilogobius chulae TaxID=88201 RepID=A0AAW0PRA2_9GOBI